MKGQDCIMENLNLIFHFRLCIYITTDLKGGHPSKLTGIILFKDGEKGFLTVVMGSVDK